MRKIRVLLVDIPGILSEIFKEIIALEPDTKVVGELANAAGLRAAVDLTAPNVVILGLSDSALPAVCGELLMAYPSLRIMALVAEGRGGFLFELRPRKIYIGEMSSETVLAALRGTLDAEESLAHGRTARHRYGHSS
ncbi:MAG: hypothetical protein ACRDIF_06290 [Actinomycetota bacterium]